jgi:hypothetical protein
MAPIGLLIEITPTPDEYEQLCSDLQRLREQGASSNTAAVVDAVHALARAKIEQGER